MIWNNKNQAINPKAGRKKKITKQQMNRWEKFKGVSDKFQFNYINNNIKS